VLSGLTQGTEDLAGEAPADAIAEAPAGNLLPWLVVVGLALAISLVMNMFLLLRD
jgi:hypothetical protein